MSGPHVVPDRDGAFPGILDLHYRQWAAVSQSRLKIMERSPAHLKAHVDEPRPPSAQQQRNFDVGSAVHMAVLQPDEFETWFVPRPVGRANSTAFKEAVSRILRANRFVRMLHAADLETVLRIRDAVHANADARVLLKGATRELSIVWTEPDKVDRDPVRGKARVDIHNPTLGVLGDVKTCLDARPDAFGRQIDNLRYYRQASWYLRGASAVGIGEDSWVFLAVEKAPPFAIYIHELPSEWIARGDAELEPLLDEYARCLADDEWPGYPSGFHRIEPTRWQLTEAERREVMLQDRAKGAA